MSRQLFWKLCISISLITMALVYVTSQASLYLERQMSLVSDEHKRVLQGYQQQASELLQHHELARLEALVQQIQTQQQTFASVIETHTRELVPQSHSSQLKVHAEFGRNIDYPIHLNHQTRPLFEFPLASGQHILVIQLPQHMMPGQYWPATHLFLHLIAPILLMVLFSVGLYRYLMKPLGKLEQATRQFSQGHYDTRLLPELNGRNDELGRLAQTFDDMAARVGTLVQTQRHLLHDLSHELRTPLQRIELCLALDNADSRERLKKEAELMRKLVEDTLTLAWLENESPDIRDETVDLVGLLDAIADDTRYEFADRSLTLTLTESLESELPESKPLEIEDSGEKALNMALENIIRNAMRYTPVAGEVSVSVTCSSQQCEIRVQDQGPGVPEEYLQTIFTPFFRLDKSRERGRGGFGLGLALAKRQVEGVGGTLDAFNNTQGPGLTMRLRVPLRRV